MNKHLRLCNKQDLYNLFYNMFWSTVVPQP